MNHATGHGTFNGVVYDSNTVTVTVDANAADVTITKTAPATALVNDTITFNITVTNNGPSTATNVTVSDPIPANSSYISATSSQGSCNATVTCLLGSIAKGSSATVTITVKADGAGTIKNVATVSASENDQHPENNSSTTTTTVSLRPTKVTYTGATTADYHDGVTASAHLIDATTLAPIAGKTISFTLSGGSSSCAGTTNATGDASCTITPNQVPGSYTITASYAGDTTYASSSDAKPFTVTKEETTTTYTGPTAAANGTTITLSGVLKEDGTTPISGRTLTLAFGTQSCTGTTNASGTASCNIVVSQTVGPTTASATFAGDAYYLPSSDSKSATIGSFTTGGGAFVIGDNNSAIGMSVTFWGAQWAKINSLSGGSAPSAFKGFAKSPTNPTCGTTWTTDPGNSAPPPNGPLPAYIVVIVTSSSTKSGSQISGNTVHMVIVKTDPGYDANPGHAGTGTVVGTIC